MFLISDDWVCQQYQTFRKHSHDFILKIHTIFCAHKFHRKKKSLKRCKSCRKEMGQKLWIFLTKEGKWDQARFWDCRNSMQARRDKKSTQFYFRCSENKNRCRCHGFFIFTGRKETCFMGKKTKGRQIYTQLVFSLNIILLTRRRLW